MRGLLHSVPMQSLKHLPSIVRYAIIGSAVLLAVPLAFISLSAVWRVVAWRTVLSEQKAYPQGVGNFRYTLRSPSIGSNLAVIFAGYRFSIELQSPGTSLQYIREKRWLCDDRIVYLKMDLRTEYDSYWLDKTAKLIFDFERGTLYTFDSPWIVGSPEKRKERAITDAEFDGILKRLDNECATEKIGR